MPSLGRTRCPRTTLLVPDGAVLSEMMCHFTCRHRQHAEQQVQQGQPCASTKWKAGTLCCSQQNGRPT